MSPARSALESLLLLAVRLGLATVFGWAAWVKLSDPQSFAFSVKAFKVLPDHLGILAAFALPWGELLCAVLLALGLWTRAAALVLSVQVTLFIAGIVSVLARKMNVECGCFGKYDFMCSGPLGWCNVGQNAILLAGAILILLRGGGAISLDRAADRQPIITP